MRLLILVILALVAFSGCSSRNFGTEKLIHIYKGDLRDRANKFCNRYNRPPTVDEIGFQNTPLPEYYWYISDYTDNKKIEYKVMLIDKETNEIITLRSGSADLTSR